MRRVCHDRRTGFHVLELPCAKAQRCQVKDSSGEIDELLAASELGPVLPCRGLLLKMFGQQALHGAHALGKGHWTRRCWGYCHVCMSRQLSLFLFNLLVLEGYPGIKLPARSPLQWRLESCLCLFHGPSCDESESDLSQGWRLRARRSLR